MFNWIAKDNVLLVLIHCSQFKGQLINDVTILTSMIREADIGEAILQTSTKLYLVGFFEAVLGHSYGNPS